MYSRYMSSGQLRGSEDDEFRSYTSRALGHEPHRAEAVRHEERAEPRHVPRQDERDRVREHSLTARGGRGGILSGLRGRFSDWDSGDILLLLIVLMLFMEGNDDELMIILAVALFIGM